MTNTNDAPIIANPIADQNAAEDAAFSFTVPLNSFADIDGGDTLAYSAAKADGSALPGWLSFDATTRTFTGTPLNRDVGTMDLKVMATDGAAESISDTFTLTVANTNDAPTVANPIGDQLATEDSPFSFTVPADVFEDVDAGDSLTYSATLVDGSPLPTWLSFDATTRTFSGTPLNGDVGSIDIKVSAVDGASASASNTFALTIASTNNAPTLANALADQSATEDVLFNFAVPANTFTDVDPDDNLIYSATLADGSALPTWLSFDANTATFSGTPANGDVASVAIRVTATDDLGNSAYDDFILSVSNTNDAPTLSNPIADQFIDEGEPWTFVVPAQTFADVDPGEQLALSASLSSGAPLPSWLSFDAQTRTFSGTPPHEGEKIFNVRLTATDSGNATVYDEFVVDVTAITFGIPGQYSEFGSSLTRDVFLGQDGHDLFRGFGREDRLYGGEGHDVLDGGDGDDLLDGGPGHDDLGGGPGNDTLLGGTGDDWMWGGDGDDFFDAGTAEFWDFAAGEGGNDTFLMGRGYAQEIWGGAGYDELVIAADILRAEVGVRRRHIEDLEVYLLADPLAYTNILGWLHPQSDFESIRFLADGSVLDREAVMTRLSTP
ncbi:MAG TPA: putative Ig domain-containing protein, partial [Nitrospira sp.]|nr:putative Ig domain-containing protein [Nitrospira sp.]